ncbi:MAG TPA: inorganic diphosphatase [Blastocatellia bacterium]|nr:inorganic diphosphatase [Blastocatellia bacterium]
MRYIDIPIGKLAPEIFNVVVEIPRDSVNKYEYDTELNVFRLDRTLYSPMHYPGDYGFVPSTLAADGDPLDVLVLVSNPSFTGCLIEVRPIGMLAMFDQGAEDLKVLCVPTRDPRSETVGDYRDVLPHRLREIEHFFSIYKELEGKTTETGGWKGAQEAKDAVIAAMNRYREKAPDR